MTWTPNTSADPATFAALLYPNVGQAADHGDERRPLRAICERARKRGKLSANPCDRLEIPAAGPHVGRPHVVVAARSTRACGAGSWPRSTGPTWTSRRG